MARPDFRLGISKKQHDLIAALQIAYTLDEAEREKAKEKAK